MDSVRSARLDIALSENGDPQVKQKLLEALSQVDPVVAAVLDVYGFKQRLERLKG